MKTFDSLNSLFDFTAFCANCGEIRNHRMTVGPDMSITERSVTQDKDYLTIRVLYKTSFHPTLITSQLVEFTINCQDNSYDRELIKAENLTEQGKQDILAELDATDVWFCFNVTCDYCSRHSTATMDIEFDSSNFTINNIGIENDDIWLPKYSYQIDSWPQKDSTCVFMLEKTERENEIITTGNGIEIPYIPVRYDRIAQDIKKIQIMLTFS